MKILAIANQKGGVGKTTTAVNLGTALALKGQRVLLIDLDAQSNLSMYLGYEEDGKPTSTDLFMYAMGKSKGVDFEGCIRHSDTNKVDYIPADINLSSVDFYLNSVVAKETVLRRITDGISDYDVIIIDCLPSLGSLLTNALTAADGYIIPVQTQTFALSGVESLLEVAELIKQSINPKLELIGILPTFAENTVISRTSVERLEDKYADKLFGTAIHKSTEAANSVEKKKSLCLTSHKLGGEYKALADEVLAKLSPSSPLGVEEELS
jgi:chromosome partitioning protein